MEKSLHVYKANALIEASYHLTLAEQRLVLLCISAIRRDQPLDESVTFTLHAEQYAEAVGVLKDTAYQELKAVAEQLFERRAVIYQQPNTGAKVRRRSGKLVTRWVQSVRYLDSLGAIELRFAYDMTPYLSQLSRQFTRYALQDVAKMKSPYAIRLYELLCQYRDQGERTVSVDWLRSLLCLQGQYTEYREFRRRVIEPAVKQINAATPMRCEWEPRKTGQYVTSLHFVFIEDAPRRASPRKPRKAKGKVILGVPEADILKRARPGETYEQAAQRIRREIDQESTKRANSAK